MSTLYPNKYTNTARTIAGSASINADDMVLFCDTSLGAVSFTLLGIPSNKWNTIWKLYVIDISNNAGTNNITINAPSGYTVNNAASIVINTNGASCVISVASNTAYLGAFNFTGTAGNLLAIQSNGTLVTSSASLLNFSDLFTLSNVGGAVAITVQDTGWVNLEGFDYYTGSMASQKPQIRRIGKQLMFRGVVYVPLVDPTNSPNVQDLSSATAYNGIGESLTYSGLTPAGCIIGDDGEITFNRNNSVIPISVLPSVTQLDNAYSTGWIFATRQIDLISVSTRNYGTSFTTPLSVSITAAKKLVVSTLYDLEVSGTSTNGFIGSNPLRLLSSRVGVDQYLPNYINNDVRFSYGDIGIDFVITAGDANVGDVYTITTESFIVTESTVAGTKLRGIISQLPPATTGTLTRVSGTGDATITFSNYSQNSQPFKFSTQQLGILNPSSAPYTYSLNTNGSNAGNYPMGFSVDGANPNSLGGFVFRLDGLTAYI